ncbi:MAG: type II toxin-antitoxin system VapC family toxin [Gordonia amarae]
MIVLDTNVVSEIIRVAPNPTVIAWIDGILDDELFISAVTEAELRYGLERLPDGRRKAALAGAIAEIVDGDFRGRVLPFDHGAASLFGHIMAERDRGGRPIDVADAQIAAICSWWGASLATRNTPDFVGTGIELVNPWTSETGGR